MYRKYNRKMLLARRADSCTVLVVLNVRLKVEARHSVLPSDSS